MGQLGEIEKAIYHELEPWVRNPACFWGWLRKQRNDLKALGAHLTNRDIYNCFTECIIVESHKRAGIIRKRYPSIEFMGDLKESARGITRGEFPSFLKGRKFF